MPSLTEWKVPPAFQPRPGDYSFDLDAVRGLAVVRCTAAPGGVLMPIPEGSAALTQNIGQVRYFVKYANPSALRTHCRTRRRSSSPMGSFR